MSCRRNLPQTPAFCRVALVFFVSLFWQCPTGQPGNWLQLGLTGQGHALAQSTLQPPPAGEPAEADDSLPAEEQPSDAPPASEAVDGPVGDGAVGSTAADGPSPEQNPAAVPADGAPTLQELTFRQKQLAAQLKELEERMYRLAEALRETEPDNASRLLDGLRYSREEQLQSRMQNAETVLEQNSAEAILVEEQLIARLKRLEELLLSKDLSLAETLARLKQLRALGSQLDRAIGEESRQRDASAQLAAAEKNAPATPESRDAAPYEGLRKHQRDNRRFTEDLASQLLGLGSSGAKPASTLGQAQSSMRGAEGQLSKRSASEAEPEQSDALDQLQQAKTQLDAAAQQLADELRREIRPYLIKNLLEMVERQGIVRAQIEAIGPRADAQDIAALAAFKRMADEERALRDLAEEMATLTEEAEYSVALPEALLVIVASLETAEQGLRTPEPSSGLVALSRQIESDLKDLLVAVRKLPPKGKQPPKPGQPSDLQSQQRELNALLSELRIVRLMQVRIQQATQANDTEKPQADSNLWDDWKSRVKPLAERQQKLKKTLERLAGMQQTEPTLEE